MATFEGVQGKVGIEIFLFRILFMLGVLVGMSGAASGATLPQVHYLGAAYAGRYESIGQRFPFVAALDHFDPHQQQPGVLTTRSASLLREIAPTHYTLTDSGVGRLSKTDQAIDLVLLLDRETVLQTTYQVEGRAIYKVLAVVHAQALYFDVVQSAIERVLPFSAAQISTFDHPPTHSEVEHCVALALFGADGNSGLLAQFSSRVAASPYPAAATRSFRVVRVTVGPKALPLVVDGKGDGAAVKDLQEDVADSFAEVFSASQGVSFIPFAADYVVGNRIALSFSDGDHFNLVLPSADYDVELDLLGAKKIFFGRSAAGQSLIYGTLMHVTLVEPLSGTRYLDGDFKNGVVVKVPATQEGDAQDDQFAYEDSMRGLFSQLSSAIQGQRAAWVSKATSAPDIDHQLQVSRALFQSCR